MGCTSDEPYLSLDKAFARIYARIMRKESKELIDKAPNKDNHIISEQIDMEQEEFNSLFKTKYEFKYDEFERLLGNVDWDAYIDRINEKRKDYLRDVNMVNTNVKNISTFVLNERNEPIIQESLIKSPTNPINKQEKDAAVVELLRQIYNVIYNRAKRTYMREFIEKLKYRSNKVNTIDEIIIISSDEEDSKETVNDGHNKSIDIEKWTFQYQDTRKFGIDTEENIIDDENEVQEYLNWMNAERDNTDDNEYKFSLIVQEAYIRFKPNNVLKSISFGIEIYKTIQNTIFAKYLEDIITFYTNFNLEQILRLQDYGIVRNNKLNEWLTHEIDKNKIMQQCIRISISKDPHYKEDTQGFKSEESSEEITEAKETIRRPNK